MNIYIAVAIGWLLGMLLTIVVQAAIIHMSDKHEDDFSTAIKKYLTKKAGPLYGALVLLLIALFVLPEVLANAAVENGDKSPFYHRYLVSVLTWLRSWSVLCGIASQSLGFFIVIRVLGHFKKGKNETS